MPGFFDRNCASVKQFLYIKFQPTLIAMRTLLITLTIAFSATLVFGQTQLRFYTTMGNFEVKVREDLVPITAHNFIKLADTNKFYDGVIFHRVIDNFMIQSGDPTGTGSGGPGYTIVDEFHFLLQHYKKGILSMANTGQPNTGGSQFFITLKPTSWLDNKHSVFGEVTMGIEIVDSIGDTPTDVNDRPITDVTIDSIRVFTPVNREPNYINGSVIAGGNFPNPFDNSTIITFGLRKDAYVNLEVFDMAGNKIKEQYEGLMNAGDQRITFDGSDLPNGQYIYRIATSWGWVSKTLTISR